MNLNCIVRFFMASVFLVVVSCGKKPTEVKPQAEDKTNESCKCVEEEYKVVKEWNRARLKMIEAEKRKGEATLEESMQDIENATKVMNLSIQRVEILSRCHLEVTYTEESQKNCPLYSKLQEVLKEEERISQYDRGFTDSLSTLENDKE